MTGTADEKNQGFSIEKSVERVVEVEKYIDVPVEIIVQKIVEVPVEKIVEKIVEAPSPSIQAEPHDKVRNIGRVLFHGNIS